VNTALRETAARIKLFVESNQNSYHDFPSSPTPCTFARLPREHRK
jgi:hypothetical protein